MVTGQLTIMKMGYNIVANGNRGGAGRHFVIFKWSITVRLTDQRIDKADQSPVSLKSASTEKKPKKQKKQNKTNITSSINVFGQRNCNFAHATP